MVTLPGVVQEQVKPARLLRTPLSPFIATNLSSQFPLHGTNGNFQPKVKNLKDDQYYVDDRGVVCRFRLGKPDEEIIGPKHVLQLEENRRATNQDKISKMMRLKLQISMSDLLEEILTLQENTPDHAIPAGQPAPWAAAQKALREKYAVFTHVFGPINKTEIRVNGKLDTYGEQGYRKVNPNLADFSKDPRASLLASAEVYNQDTGEASLGSIAYKRVLAAHGEAINVDTPLAALGASLSAKNRIDFAYMGNVLHGRDLASIRDDLIAQDAIFFDPEKEDWVPADDYLSGDVRKKMEAARTAVEKNPVFERNVRALAAIIPADLGPEDIAVDLGMPWISPAVIEEFMREELGLRDVKVEYFSGTHSWFIGGKAENSRKNFDVYGTEFVSSLDVLGAALKGTKLSVLARKDRNGDVVNRDLENSVAQDRLDKLKARFQSWIWEDQGRTTELTGMYNRRFNAIVPRVYSGAHLGLPGANIDIMLRDYQINAIWRGMQNGNTLFALAVGAGKTWISVADAMKSKQMTGQKKCFVLPRNMMGQFPSEFLQLYPQAKLLVIDDDRLKEGGKKPTLQEKINMLVEKAQNPALDAVIMPVEVFNHLRLSPQNRLQRALEDLRNVKVSLDKAEADPEVLPEYAAHVQSVYTKKKKAVLEILELYPNAVDETQKQNEETRLSAQTPEEAWTEWKAQEDAEAEGGKPKESEIIAKLWQEHGFDARMVQDANNESWRPYLAAVSDFHDKHIEDLGIQSFTFDEAHAYKNLLIQSRIQGMSRKGSARANNLEEITWYLNRVNPGRYLNVMTATPISNSIAEAYTWQRYMQPDLLKEYGLECFGAWAAMFGEVIDSFEISPEGRDFRVVPRMANFKNLAELMRMFHSMAEVVLPEDLKLPIPPLKNGAPEIVTIPRPKGLDKFYKKLAERAMRVRSGFVSPTEDNMLKIIMDGRLATLHPSLVGEKTGRDDVTKLDVLADHIAGRYHAQKGRAFCNQKGEFEARTGTLQAVMCDLGVNETKIGAAIFDLLRQKLVKRGVPADLIKDVHEYPKPEKKQELFKACDDGKVAVMKGTTATSGTGNNYPKRLSAMHHVDITWRPMDLIQRNGRIERQGNQNPEIEILYYLMENSLDTYMWQTNLRKAAPINAFMRADYSKRRVSSGEDDMMALCREMITLGVNNPLVREQFDLDMDVGRLEILKQAHLVKVVRDHKTAKNLSTKIEEKEQIYAENARLWQRLEDAAAGQYPLRIGDQSAGNAVEAGGALRDVLRNLRAEMGRVVPGEEGVLSKDVVIGTLYGLDLKVRAMLKKNEKTAEAPNSDKYSLDIVIVDSLGHVTPVKASKFRETALEKSWRRAVGSGIGMPAGLPEEAIAEQAAALAERLVKPYREMPEDLRRQIEEIGGLKEQRDLFIAQALQSFAYQKELGTKKKRLKAIQNQLSNQDVPEAGDNQTVTPDL